MVIQQGWPAEAVWTPRAARALAALHAGVRKKKKKKTDIMEEIILQMFRVMQRVAEYSCDYVRRGRLGGQLYFLDFAHTDDCSENGWRTGQPGHNRRNRKGLDQSD